MQIIKSILIILMTLTLLGCGGGGGGGGTSDPDGATSGNTDGSGGSGSSGSGDSSGSGSGGTGGTTTSDLVSDSTSTLQGALDNVTGISTEQATTIAEAAAAQIEADGHSDSDNASEVLPSMLSGTMTGIGELGLTDADLINSLVEQSITTIMGLLGDDAGTARLLRSAGRSFEETQSLLEILVNTAVAGLEKTKLPKASLGAGVGKVVSAVVSNLDKAKVPSDNVSAAMGSVVTKSMESLENFPADVDLGDSVDQITSNAISGAGNLASRDANINLSESIGTAVSSVVSNLDKAKVSSDNVSTAMSSLVTKSMESLSNIPKDRIGDSVDQIASNAISGVGKLASKLAQQDNTTIDVSESVGKAVSAVVSNLDRVAVDSADVATKVEKVVNKSMETLESLDTVDLSDTVDQITQQAIEGTKSLKSKNAANLADLDLGESVGKVVSSVVKNLNKAKVSADNVSSAVERVVSKSMESLEGEGDTDVSNSVQQITDAAIKGVGILAEEGGDEDFKNIVKGNLSATVTSVAKSATEGLGKIFEGKTEGKTLDDFLSEVDAALKTSVESTTQFVLVVVEIETLISDGKQKGQDRLNNACNFAGKKYLGGDPVRGFPAASVPFGEQCRPVARVCGDDGQIIGGDPFTECQEEEPVGCTFGEKTLEHGEDFSTYLSATVSFGEQCVGEKRECYNGEISPGIYSLLECQPKDPVGCSFNDVEYAHGEEVTFYKAALVPNGQTCNSETVTCENGVLGNTFTELECKVEEPVVEASCELDGQTVASGETIEAYISQSVPSGETCTPLVRNCTNGFLDGNEDYAFSTCEEESPTGYLEGVFCGALGDASCQAADVARFGQAVFGK